MTVDAALASGLEALHLSAVDEVEDKLLVYIALVQKWNRVYNLTAIREPEKMLTHHVLDSLSVVPHLTGMRIVDVGSGAGLPGIPIALALPRSYVTLVESSHKKSTFLKQAVIELELKNVEVANARAEAWHPSPRFDIVISRAFSDLGEFVALAGHLCAEDGVLAAMKGVYPYDELNRVPAGYHVDEVKPLNVPGLEAERHLVMIRPVKEPP
ncbi:MAG TPA: 16S rRNA (guanine(527)-N(7))-methyltransferase RsmG [Burkholderiales bacterium]|nr:16S rRNA (guanine(527)-N(7))-methyltransferase RsmG [Burkholderiales bacterium]